MTGYVENRRGERWTLPVLTAWEIRRTDGDPCGAFTVRFAADGGAAEILKGAETFQAEEDGKTCFTGVVDECTVTLDGGGLTAEITGRDLSARLLDSQCRAAEFLSAQLEDILSRYVRPCGITKIRTDNLPAVPNFAVQTGDTCWQALAGYCRHAAEVYPRFSADGTLLLERRPAGRQLVLTMANGPTAVQLRETRYGVISEQTVLDFTRKSVEQVGNPDFDGLCRKVTARSGKTLKADWRTAAQRIADSQRNRTALEVTVPGGFAAEPWDRISVSFPELGVSGGFLVAEAVTRLDGRGLQTALSLRTE